MALNDHAARCFGCRRGPMAIGALCDRCAEGLRLVDGLIPEHLESPPGSSTAWLVDPWGRLHAVYDDMVIGRRGQGLVIRSPGVSRQHARLSRAGDAWWVEDLGSRNGTTVDSRPAAGGAPIEHGQRLSLGDLELWFVEGEPEEEHHAAADSSTRSAGAAPGIRRFVLNASREVRLELLEPTAAEGAILAAGDLRLHVTLLQLHLVERLASQLETDRSRPEPVRGYVPSLGLLAELPWATPKADTPHLKQLVRRTRRMLEDVGLTIEGRQGFGYRLWAT